jgi:hypothetical protein
LTRSPSIGDRRLTIGDLLTRDDCGIAAFNCDIGALDHWCNDQMAIASMAIASMANVSIANVSIANVSMVIDPIAP